MSLESVRAFFAAKAPDIPFDNYEAQTEEQLLALANQSRRKAGAPPLRLDAGLSQAARTHALAMLEGGEGLGVRQAAALQQRAQRAQGVAAGSMGTRSCSATTWRSRRTRRP